MSQAFKTLQLFIHSVALHLFDRKCISFLLKNDVEAEEY